MADKKVYYKTILKVVIISKTPYTYDTLTDLSYDIDEGQCVGEAYTESEVELSEKEAKEEIEELGSDPMFFDIDTFECEHDLVDENNEGVYGTEVCRLCGQRFKDGEPIDED